jgi:K+/H+ antiporter YhaU regulatory subunit KhtT
MRASEHPPIYSQVAYDIAAKIMEGELQEGQRFSGRSLMGPQYGVSPETIRRALRLLSDMGIIQVQQNVGSVVSSRRRAAEYVEQYQVGKDLRGLKLRLKKLVSQRDQLNEEINDTFRHITDLEERFQHSDRLRTYEFPLAQGGTAAGRSIGELSFRQRTGATVVAVRRVGEILLSPGPELVLEPEDVLVVACAVADIGRVSELLGQTAAL